MAELFDRDIKTIGKHINNALKEKLKEISVVAKFVTTASDGKTYQVDHYNIEMITSVAGRPIIGVNSHKVILLYQEIFISLNFILLYCEAE